MATYGLNRAHLHVIKFIFIFNEQFSIESNLNINRLNWTAQLLYNYTYHQFFYI